MVGHRTLQLSVDRPDTEPVRADGRRLFLIGTLFAVPLTAPFLLIDALSENTGSGLYWVGLFGIPLAALVIQVREARTSLRHEPTRLARPVLRSTFAFIGGAAVVVFIAFVPIARALGTFADVEGTSIPGELFFLVFAAIFAGITLITAALVIGTAAAMRRISRKPLT